MSRKAKTFLRILLSVYLVTVFILCFGKFEAGPDIKMSLWGIPTDKLVHFAMFFPFPILSYFSLSERLQGKRRRIFSILLIFAAGLLLAMVTEFAQHFIPYRTGDWHDFIADSLGILTATLILLPFVCRKD